MPCQVRDASREGEHLASLGAEVIEVKTLGATEALADAFAEKEAAAIRPFPGGFLLS